MSNVSHIATSGHAAESSTHRKTAGQRDRTKRRPLGEAMPTARQFASVTMLLVLLFAAAYWAAEVQTSQAEKALALGIKTLGNPWKGASQHDFNYFMTINTITISIVLLIPAFALFILRRGTEAGSMWLMLWTAAYIAFLLHLWFGVLGVFKGNFATIFSDVDTAGVPIKPPRVTNPYPDTVTTVWWTADVVLAWLGVRGPRWVQIERSLLHLVVFLSAAMSSIVLSSNGYVRVFGVILVVVTLFSVAYRIVVFPLDPQSAMLRLYTWIFQGINLLAPWYRLPTWPAVFNLGALRLVLRRYNLHNTSSVPVSRPAGAQLPPPWESRYQTARQQDGYYNDLTKPSMGSSSPPAGLHHDSMLFEKSNPGARFGRNVPLSEAFPEAEPALMQPNPRVVSQKLLARREFIPAKTLNLLAAAWIQFETHDWFNHGEPLKEDVFEIPLNNDDPWVQQVSCPIMKIRKTRPDPTRDYKKELLDNGNRLPLPYPPTYVNAETHWWDASQIYGSNAETTRKLRTLFVRSGGKLAATGQLVSDGKLFLDHNDLRLDPTELGNALTGFAGNWWAGLSILHTVFAREHNAICDRLRLEYPYWDGNMIFAKARMINAALMAKIHTVEWTPAILAHPALEIGMNANWWGLETERIYRSLGRISDNEAFGGIPLSGVDHSDADYCLTEEFVSVYRMHPLIPDELEVRSAKDGHTLRTFKMPEGVVGQLKDLTVFGEGRTMSDVIYSFGVSNPGAITIHNFPNFLRQFNRITSNDEIEIVDLAAIDVVRDRERGVPRYNRFRQLFHKKPIQSFDELANPLHPHLPQELREVYGRTNGKDNVDRLDLIVGLFSETPPQGFGFSDTAFRVFILMASRRLKSDRFIAQDFRPEVYTPLGIEWVNNNTMVSVLLRHFPDLAPALDGVTNAFKPWKPI